MGRFKKKSGGGGGGGNAWTGTALSIFGSVAMLMTLIMFGIGITQLDTSYTAAASYPEMTSLTSIMGVFGVVIFLAFMILGLGAIAGGTYMNVKQGLGGGWQSIMMLAVFGGVSLLIALIMYNVNLTALHNAYVTANATTNKAAFVGLLDIMGIWGMVIFVTMIGASLAQFGFAGVGAFKKLKGS